MKEMIKKLQKRSNKKGFTLVEIIVVLVILAILAAIAVPAVLGYVNDARDSQYIQEARSIYLVVQTEDAKVRAENDKAKDVSIADVDVTYQKATKAGGKTTYAEATEKFYTYIVNYASQKTELDVTTVSKTTDGYTIEWNSGDKGITATVKTNKDITITKGAKH